MHGGPERPNEQELLPRLLYIGDVPVEATHQGAAVLYRLLQGYSPKRLYVIEGGLVRSSPEGRLTGVRYKKLSIGRTRMLTTRLHRWWSLLLTIRSLARTRQVQSLLDGFVPEAVLTVLHGHAWLTAAGFAQRHQLPLHLIVHDDWPSMAQFPRPFTEWLDKRFGRVYRTAASRLCVSPFMVQEYLRRYGVDGEVLYPSHAASANLFAAPPDRVRESKEKIVFAFAGTIASPGSCRLLRTLAECLEPHRGMLLIFGPLTPAQAASASLNLPNIRLCGLLKANDLAERLRSQVDVLVVPMSFAPQDRPNMEVSFPSKLTDYTSVGLPILIVGPRYCSAVRWAHENPGVAEVVDEDARAPLVAAIGRLVNNVEHRVSLGQGALTIGNRFFSASAAQGQLRRALLSV